MGNSKHEFTIEMNGYEQGCNLPDLLQLYQNKKATLFTTVTDPDDYRVRRLQEIFMTEVRKKNPLIPMSVIADLEILQRLENTTPAPTNPLKRYRFSCDYSIGSMFVHNAIWGIFVLLSFGILFPVFIYDFAKTMIERTEAIEI